MQYKRIIPETEHPVNAVPANITPGNEHACPFHGTRLTLSRVGEIGHRLKGRERAVPGGDDSLLVAGARAVAGGIDARHGRLRTVCDYMSRRVARERIAQELRLRRPCRHEKQTVTEDRLIV